MIETLRSALTWKPQSPPKDGSDDISRFEDEIARLRQDRRDLQTRIDSARQFSRKAGGFESEAAEQKDRLLSIRALPRNSSTGEWQWPFSEKNLGLDTPIATALLNELNTLDSEIAVVAGQRPRLESYLSDLETRIREISDAIEAQKNNSPLPLQPTR